MLAQRLRAWYHRRSEPAAALSPALLTLPLAALLWLVVFQWRPLPFFPLMAMATGALAAIALLMQGPVILRQGVHARDLLLGAGSALALWAVFWLGGHLADAIFPFAAEGIDDVYDFKADQSLLLVGALHLLVISPAEELYWRGLVQSTFQGRWGIRGGWLAGTAAYGGVHVLTGNPMLVIAAAVAGGAWGALYAWQGRLLPVVVSHALWGVLVFLVLPLGG